VPTLDCIASRILLNFSPVLKRCVSQVFGVRDLSVGLFARGGLNRRRAVVAAARSLAAAFAIVLLAGEAAWAECTPAAANDVTAICTGTTTNQGRRRAWQHLRLRHRSRDRRHRQC
jgi:hypothetical protein